MLQVPVEGGHQGCDLIIRHEQEDTKLDRSQENGRKFYLSASFIDCPHQVTPVTEGWSVALTFYLVWEKPFVVYPHGMNFPTFISSLKMVKEILSPMLSPIEDCDTELVIIPLTNDYAKTPLNYNNLRGTDKLMANLLQSMDSLEIRLGTVVKYQGGTAYNEQQMNIDHAEDDGFPDSPTPLKLDDLPFRANSKRRFVANIISSYCCFENLLLLSGKKVEKNSIVPLSWKRDYIFNNIQSAKDLFDEISPPDKEIYDRYQQHGRNFGTLELQQWWYKPVLIFWPKNSVAIQCREYISTAVFKLTRMATSYPVERQKKLFELRKIVNYLKRVQFHGDGNLFDPIDDGEHKKLIFTILFSVCNKLKAKEEAIDLINFCTSQPTDVLNFSDFEAEFVELIRLVGWDACRELFSTMSSQYDIESHLLFTTNIIKTFLDSSSPLQNQPAAVQIFKYLYSVYFSPSEVLEIFTSKVESLCEVGRMEMFLLIILLLERCGLLLDDTEHLIDKAASYLTAIPIDSSFNLKIFFSLLSSSSLIVDSSFVELSGKLQKLLISLCEDFLTHCNYQSIRPDSVVGWIQVFTFSRRHLLQQLMDNICQQKMPDKKLLCFLKAILAEKQIQKPLKTVHSQLKRTCKILKKRARFEVRRSISYVNSCHASLLPQVIEFAELINVVDLCIGNPIYDKKLTEEGAEEEFESLCDVMKLCKQFKLEGMRILEFYSAALGDGYKHFWLRPEFLTVMADFVVFSDQQISSTSLLYSSKCPRFEKERLHYIFLLMNEMLDRGDAKYDRAAVKISRLVLGIDTAYSQVLYTTSDNADSTKGISSLDDKQRQLFCYVVLFMYNRNLLSKPFFDWVQLSFDVLQSSPIDSLNYFVELLFNGSATLTSLPFDNLFFRCQNSLNHLCSRFLDYTRDNLSIVMTENCLYWLRLFAYVDNFSLLQSLMTILCSGAKKDNNASLRNLLANEEFQTEEEFKTIRKHPILVEWKRSQKKNLFARREPAEKKKRKLTTADGSFNQKKVKLDLGGYEV